MGSLSNFNQYKKNIGIPWTCPVQSAPNSPADFFTFHFPSGQCGFNEGAEADMRRLHRPTQTRNNFAPSGLLITGPDCNTIIKTGTTGVTAQWRRQAIVKGLGAVTSSAARGNAVFRVSWRLGPLLNADRHPSKSPHSFHCLYIQAFDEWHWTKKEVIRAREPITKWGGQLHYLGSRWIKKTKSQRHEKNFLPPFISLTYWSTLTGYSNSNSTDTFCYNFIRAFTFTFRIQQLNVNVTSFPNQ